MAKTYNVGRLSVEMVADTVQYVQKLKEAEKRTKQSHDNIQKDYKKTKTEADKGDKSNKKYSDGLSKLGQAAALINGPMGGVASRIGAMNSLLGGSAGTIAVVGGTAIAIGAASAAIYGMGVELSSQYKELKVYAEIAGITTREMQLLSVATSRVGISQEKFGDQIKDVRDKLGDFVATGAGPFVDVFEVLGNNLKYTAYELQQMAGPDALEAIMHAMQDANIPMGEQIFLMESLASDSSKLIPLYADYSSEMNRLSYETDITTRALDDQLTAYSDLSRSLNLAKQNTSDYLAEAGAPLAEWLDGIIKGFNIYISSLDKTSEAHRLMRMDELRNEMDLLKNAIDASTTGWGRFKIVMNGLTPDVEILTQKLQEATKEYHKLIQLGVDQQMPSADDNKPNQSFNESSVGPTMPPYLDMLRAAEIERQKDQKKADEKAAKQLISHNKRLESEAKRNAKERAKIEKERNKQIYKDQIAADKAMDDLRKQYIEKEQDRYDLEKMALEGPIMPMGGVGGSDMIQAQLDNQLSILELNLNQELELLRQNYAHKTELENEYQAAMQASKNQYYANVLEAHKSSVQAEMQLYSQMGSVLGNHISALAGASDEEKKQLTKQFLMQQALAAGQSTIEYFATMAAHEKAAAAMGPAGAAYLATQSAIATANWQKNLAGIAAVSVAGGLAGQFHGGVDSLDPSMDNKSFLLKAGERVVQPEANKDLTTFLSNPNSGGVEINAPMTIQGNVTDKKWFSEQLVQHRNTIAAAYQKVQKERPRRR